MKKVIYLEKTLSKVLESMERLEIGIYLLKDGVKRRFFNDRSDKRMFENEGDSSLSKLGLIKI